MTPLPAELTGAAFDALPWAACLIDAEGIIVAGNRHWRTCGVGTLGPGAGAEGTDYLEACARAGEPRAAALLMRVLRGETPETEYEYECVAGATRARFRLHFRALGGAEARSAMLLHEPLDAVRQMELELRESERHFRELIEMSSDWYWESDREDRITALTARRGADRPDYAAAVGKRLWDRALEPVGFTWAEHKADHAARRPYADAVFRFTDAQQQRHYWSITGKPVFDAAGNYRGYRGIGREITDRHRWQTLRIAQARLFERLLAGASLQELTDTLCREVGAVLFRAGFVTIQEMRGDRIYVLAAPDMPPLYKELLAGGVPTGDGPDTGACGTAVGMRRRVVCESVRTDPHWAAHQGLLDALAFNGACWSTPLFGTAGEPIGAFAVYHAQTGEPHERDLEIVAHASHLAAMIIEQVRARTALAASETRFRSVVEQAQDGLVIHAPDGIRYCNPAMLRMLGAQSVEQIRHIDPLTRLCEPYRSRALARRLDMLENEAVHPFIEMRLRTLDERVIDIEVASGTTEWQGQRVVQSQVRDLSARKWTERQILRMNETLEEAVEERTGELRGVVAELEGFSYMVAHDLRAPLRSIDGYASLLPDDLGIALPDNARRDLEAIRRSAQHMGDLIDGLLRFSQASRAELACADLPTREAILAIAAEFDPHGRAHLELGELPNLHGDPLLLRQVLVNLLTNAFKYSAGREHPVVTVSAERRESEGRSEVVICVADNGVGFDPAYADKLFGIFQRLHTRQEFEGLGAGLAIVRRVIERHGGKVWAEGQPNVGARFFFSLPVKA